MKTPFLRRQIRFPKKALIFLTYCAVLIAIPSALASITWPNPPEGAAVGGDFAGIIQTDMTSGKVGIGTDSPAERFTVMGTGGQVTLMGNSTDGDGGDCEAGQEKVPLDPVGMEAGYEIGEQAIVLVGAGFVCTADNLISWTSGDIKWWKNPDTESVFDGNGYLGINTSAPAEALDVNGNAVIRGDGIGEFTALQITFGNVGIGTVNVSAKLDVVGTTELNGDTDVIGDFNVNGNAGGTSGWTQTSDLNLKTNIRPLTGLENILKLQGVRFDWKENGEPAIGIIAQEVEQVFPEVVKTNANGMKSVDYASLVAPLIEAVKELKAEQDELVDQINELEQILAE